MGGWKSEKNGRIYCYKVINCLQRRGIKQEEIVNIESECDYKRHSYDIDVPHLNLKIEVKGSMLYRKDDKDSYFLINTGSYHKESNIYAFVFGKGGFVLFLTKSEFLDLAGRKRLKRVKELNIYHWEVIRKALLKEDVYNY